MLIILKTGVVFFVVFINVKFNWLRCKHTLTILHPPNF